MEMHWFSRNWKHTHTHTYTHTQIAQRTENWVWWDLFFQRSQRTYEVSSVRWIEITSSLKTGTEYLLISDGPGLILCLTNIKKKKKTNPKNPICAWLGFPEWLNGKEPACWYMFDPLVGKIPWRRKWQPTPVFLPGESHGQRSLVGYS